MTLRPASDDLLSGLKDFLGPKGWRDPADAPEAFREDRDRFTGAGAMVALSETLLRSGYQLEAETAADAFAADLMTRQGLPTEGLAIFMEKLHAEVGDMPEWVSHLSTHPDLTGRAEAARAAYTIGDQPFTPALTDQQWVALKGICG